MIIVGLYGGLLGFVLNEWLGDYFMSILCSTHFFDIFRATILASRSCGPFGLDFNNHLFFSWTWFRVYSMLIQSTWPSGLRKKAGVIYFNSPWGENFWPSVLMLIPKTSWHNYDMIARYPSVAWLSLRPCGRWCDNIHAWHQNLKVRQRITSKMIIVTMQSLVLHALHINVKARHRIANETSVIIPIMSFVQSCFGCGKLTFWSLLLWEWWCWGGHGDSKWIQWGWQTRETREGQK